MSGFKSMSNKKKIGIIVSVILFIALIISALAFWYNSYKRIFIINEGFTPNEIQVGEFTPIVPNSLGTRIPFTSTEANKTEEYQLVPNTQMDQNYPKLQSQLTSETYPIFADAVPPAGITPVEDMPSISDQYLQINQGYNYDGSRFTNLPDNIYMLDDGNGGNLGTLNNACSKSCCAPQWPVPFKSADDKFTCFGGNVIGSNYACNSTFQNAGCMCMTKEQALNITTRGGNAGKDIIVY